MLLQTLRSPSGQDDRAPDDGLGSFKDTVQKFRENLVYGGGYDI